MQNVQRKSLCATLALITLVVTMAPAPARAQRTVLKPGWNMFSPEQDVQLGQEAAKEVEQQLPMLNDSQVDAYLNQIGKKLVAHTPGEKYPYHYKAVNDNAINAFALPGGFVYINRGVIANADNEAQLAAVMAHETSHVALRHGTNQASKQQAAQAPLAVLGGMLGGNSVAGVLAQLGAGFVLNSVLLKYSREDETQADVLGTQIMFDAGYDPHAMAAFFQKIQAEDRSRPVEFFSDHPNPDNRVGRVNQEIAKLGAMPQGLKTNTDDFDSIKQHLASLPAAPPPAKARAGTTPSGSGTPTAGGGASGGPVVAQPGQEPPAPSSHAKTFKNSFFQMNYPDNWTAYTQGDAATIVPPNGVVRDQTGKEGIAYGAIVNAFDPQAAAGARMTLAQATDKLVQQLRQSNPQMHVTQSAQQVKIGGAQGLMTKLSNASPSGGNETDWLVTMPHPEGVAFVLFVAPEGKASSYQQLYQQMLASAKMIAQ